MKESGKVSFKRAPALLTRVESISPATLYDASAQLTRFPSANTKTTPPSPQRRRRRTESWKRVLSGGVRFVSICAALRNEACFVNMCCLHARQFAPIVGVRMSLNKLSFDDRVKPKNVLALNEKVAAIRRYEADPVYKSVGRFFNCSPDQIKRIIKQKDEILLEWNNRTRKTVIPTSHEVKTVKMSFLGKAVHEWIRRMMYYTDFNLTNALIQTMAIEFKKVLGLQNFFPDKMWIVNFRNTYGLKEVNTKTLDIGHQESLSVQIRDILRYLQSTCGSDGSTTTDIDVSASSIQTIVNGFDLKEEDSSVPFYKYGISLNSAPSTSTAASGEVPVNPSNPVIMLPPVMLKSEPEEEEAMQASSQQDRSISSYEDAMNCVKQLEEFALLKENFRLIGLIERLEEALKEAC